MFNTSNDLMEFVDVFQKVILRNMYVLSGDLITTISEDRFQFMTDIKFTTRLFLLDDVDIQTLWMEKIRNNKDVADFVSSLMTELSFYTAANNNQLGKVIDECCIAYLSTYDFTVAKKSKQDAKFDEDFFNNIIGRDEAIIGVSDYPWLKVLILIKLCNYSFFAEAFARDKNPPGKKRPSAKPEAEKPATPEVKAAE